MKDIPKKYKILYDKGMKGNSRKASIRANCLECCGWNVEETRGCAAKECTLWKFRLKG